MIVSKNFSLKGIFIVIALGVVLLLGGLNYLTASSNHTATEATNKDLAVKTFGIDTDKVKILYAGDVFNNNKTAEDQPRNVKLAAALSELTDAKIFDVGDYRPVFFLEEDNKVSIAIKHADGTLSLTNVDISKDRPVIIDNEVKAVAE